MSRFTLSAEIFIEDHLVEPLLHGDEKHRQWLKEQLIGWTDELAEEFESFYEEGREAVKEAIRYA